VLAETQEKIGEQALTEPPILELKNLSKHFPSGGGLLGKPKTWVKAVDGVTFCVQRGQSFGLVGESGCGKTTLGRLILRLIQPSGGRVVFDGRDITDLTPHALRPLRRKMQMIFQDPYGSLDPRMTIEAIVTEPLRMDPSLTLPQRRRMASRMLAKVGLAGSDLKKYPHEFSGGQRQRIGIARALCVNPELLVADEPVSALDVSIQAQVLNLMQDLKDALNLSYVFISHNLRAVAQICDQVAVMYLGGIVEVAPLSGFSRAPLHPYAKALAAAAATPDPRNRLRKPGIQGDVPSPMDPPAGCAFHPRCPLVLDICRWQRPQLVEVRAEHQVACWLNEGRGLAGPAGARGR
jgi:oligopeptide/dipeptide ABC transporter ATP-binding protein